jgi:predicted enzyme related to lactoylglutathione lyase
MHYMRDMKLGLYVAVSDLSQAKSFYSKLFSVEPYLENDNFVGFEISGGRFGALKESAYAYPVTRGNSAVPNIRVADVQAEFERVKGLEPSMIQESITDLGAMKLFMFADPDGNVIEFYSVE